MTTCLNDRYLARNMHVLGQTKTGKDLGDGLEKMGKVCVLAMKTAGSVLGAFLAISLFLGAIGGGMYGAYYVGMHISPFLALVVAAASMAVAGGIFFASWKIYPEIKDHLQKEWIELTHVTDQPAKSVSAN